MSANTAAIAQDTDAARWLRARVDVVAGLRPTMSLLNPLWAALTIVPLGGFYPVFGVLPTTLLAALVAVHLVNSAIVVLIHRYWRKNPDATPRIFRMLIAQVVLVSASWGLGACLYWVDGNAANNTFVAILVVGMMWANALTRSAHPALFAASLVPLATLFWLRAIFGTGEGAQVFAIFTPLFAAYAWFLGQSARERMDQLIRSHFENEDLARALEAAKTQALAKSIEAETASAAKSAFLANMSHELRTPLNAVLGFSEIIANESLGPDATAKYRDYARDIHQSGAHLLHLINDMLDVAKIEAGRVDLEREQLYARELVDAVLHLTELKSQSKQQTVTVSLEPNVRLYADERAFKQILLNLVSNAVKFTPARGDIAVGLVNDASGAARLTVEDSGPGIPAAVIERLFKPFAQVDNRYDRSGGGTGLGLALVRGLAALHGGKVWLENKPTGGLRVCVEFPASEAHSRAA